MKKIVAIAALICASAFLMSACCGEKRNLPKGIDGKIIDKTAKSWLAKLDKGYFQQCYDETDKTLRNNLDGKQWLENMTAYRKPLGAADKRKEANMFYENKLQNSEAGNYVIVQYASVFQQKLTVIENVTLVESQDGSWKVFGYSLK